MYNLIVIYTAENENTIRKFYNEISKAGIVETSQKEEGNCFYECYFSAARKNEMILLEKWQNKEDEVRHDNKPHLSRLREIKTKYRIETAIVEL